MTDSDAAQEQRKVKVDMESLEMAFEDRSPEVSYYLDLDTGEVVAITFEINEELQSIYEEMPEEYDEGAFEEALRKRGLPEWMEEAVQKADLVETGYGERFFRVPNDESRDAYGDAYGDMADFIGTVADGRLRDRLERSIAGKGAFRRFKYVLLDYPGERERWFRFKSDRLRGRIVAWLGEEGVDPV